MNLEPLIQLGIGGLSVFLMYKLSANHIEHNTAAIEKLAEVVEGLKDWLKENGARRPDTK